jgi:dihydroxyacetone kinase-like protein
MEKVNRVFIKKVLGQIANVMQQEKQYLIELDGAMGDGDLGLTMSSGFKAV